MVVFPPISKKMLLKLDHETPRFEVKIQEIFDLPPPSHSLRDLHSFPPFLAGFPFTISVFSPTKPQPKNSQSHSRTNWVFYLNFWARWFFATFLGFWFVTFYGNKWSPDKVSLWITWSRFRRLPKSSSIWLIQTNIVRLQLSSFFTDARQKVL